MKPPLLAATTLLAALAWTVALIVNASPFPPAPALLIGFGLVTTASVATVGMIVVGGRWAHRLGLVSLGITLILAVVRPIDAMWAAGVICTTLALVALLSPPLTATIRKLASASGPPPRAILPPLILLLTPVVLGLAGADASVWALLTVGLSAPLAAFLYSRVLPGGLLGIRIVWPVLAVILAPPLGLIAGPVSVALAVAVAVTARDEAVKASYHPPREVGSTFPIPPELAPKEVLDEAQIDEKGRRK